MRDDAIALLAEEEHLCVPGISGEGPAVGEGDGLSGAPVFVVDGCAVFGRDGRHASFSLFVQCGMRAGGMDRAKMAFRFSLLEVWMPEAPNGGGIHDCNEHGKF